jgi:hemerythrin
MALLKWTPEYRIGIGRIDDDHKYLFELINDFHCAQTQHRERKEIARILNRLAEYAEEHFAREEHIMREHGYPGVDRHEMVHAELFELLFVLQQHFEEGRIQIERDTIEFLRSWLVEHIAIEDMAFSRFMDEKGCLADAVSN